MVSEVSEVSMVSEASLVSKVSFSCALRPG